MTQAAQVCASCDKVLVVEVEPDEEDGDVEMRMDGASSATVISQKTVPDDCQLSCGHHFHWSCLLQGYTVHECPHCAAEVLSTTADGMQQVLCTMQNEGGLQENLDILALLTEEAYLKTYPEERKARAFLEFCREGDLGAIIDILKDGDADKEEEMHDLQDESGQKEEIDMLRYQDPLGDMQSGLHAAVAAGSREVAWLLLLLATNLDLQQFPPEVFQEASVLGMMREEQMGKTDIRSLKDSKGRTAAQDAEDVTIFHGWQERLAP